jgi:hypothetical protein
MNRDALGAIGEIIGAVAVFATLAYLSTQIKLSNKSAIASTEIDVRNNFSSINEMMLNNPEIAVLPVKAKDPQASFSEIEEIQLQAWIRRMLNAQLSIETAYKNSMVPDDTYHAIFDDTRAIIKRYPGMITTYKLALDNWSALENRRAVS